MITVDDIAGAVKARCDAVTNFTTAVPGAAWFGTGPDAPAGYPYLVFTVEAGEARVASGTAYVQAFVAKLAAYAPVGASGVNPQNVAKALDECFGTAAGQTAMKASVLRNAAERILHSRPLAPSGAFDKSRREGRDVFVVGAGYELLAQGDRSAS